MVTDEEISEAVKSLLNEWNRIVGGTTQESVIKLNQVMEQLQAKLGIHDLTHKLDFIKEQINILLSKSPQPQPQFPLLHLQQQHHQQQRYKDLFALPQNPNFLTSLPSNHLPLVKTEVAVKGATSLPPPPRPAVPAVAVTGNEVPKESIPVKAKRRGGCGGLNKLCGVSPELQVIVGQPALPRTEIVKQLWAYIRKNNLQDPSNKRKIICNDDLRVVFETDCTDMFKMNKLLAKHIIPLEPNKQPHPKKLKVEEPKAELKVEGPKIEVESTIISSEPAPSVMISDALANFFGITGREMLQSKVLRCIWDYVKVNQLEDPGNPMAIVCDAKLKELFGCERISAMGIPEVLGRHHILRRS